MRAFDADAFWACMFTVAVVVAGGYSLWLLFK